MESTQQDVQPTMEEEEEESFIPVPQYNEGVEEESKESDISDTQEKEVRVIKPKKVLTAKQLESLVKGRERLLQKRQDMKKQRIEALVEGYLEQKAKESVKSKKSLKRKNPTPPPPTPDVSEVSSAVSSSEEEEPEPEPVPPKKKDKTLKKKKPRLTWDTDSEEDDLPKAPPKLYREPRYIQPPRVPMYMSQNFTPGFV
jgi:hypothetical protein